MFPSPFSPLNYVHPSLPPVVVAPHSPEVKGTSMQSAMQPAEEQPICVLFEPSIEDPWSEVPLPLCSSHFPKLSRKDWQILKKKRIPQLAQQKKIQWVDSPPKLPTGALKKIVEILRPAPPAKKRLTESEKIAEVRKKYKIELFAKNPIHFICRLKTGSSLEAPLPDMRPLFLLTHFGREFFQPMCTLERFLLRNQFKMWVEGLNWDEPILLGAAQGTELRGLFLSSRGLALLTPKKQE